MSKRGFGYKVCINERKPRSGIRSANDNDSPYHTCKENIRTRRAAEEFASQRSVFTRDKFVAVFEQLATPGRSAWISIYRNGSLHDSHRAGAYNPKRTKVLLAGRDGAIAGRKGRDTENRPLNRGCSRKTISKNISKLMHEGGRSRSQIIAIALSEARRTGRGKCLRELGGHRRRVSGASGGSAVTVDDFASMVFADVVQRTGMGFDAAEKLVNKNADLVMVDYEFWRAQRQYSAAEVAKITAESLSRNAARKNRKK